MSTNARFAKILEDLGNLEREREAQDSAWQKLGPQLARAGQTELWVESLPVPPPTSSAAFWAGVRA